MAIHEKVVTRYEAVCDACGKYLGESSDRHEARKALAAHQGPCGACAGPDLPRVIEANQ
jgi:hypothetical protein